MNYLGENTLALDTDKCIGCMMCTSVCPHAVFEKDGKKKVALVAAENCIECGGCAGNCPVGAIEVTAGVGCASAILNSWINGGEPSCDCTSGTACC